MGEPTVVKPEADQAKAQEFVLRNAYVASAEAREFVGRSERLGEPGKLVKYTEVVIVVGGETYHATSSLPPGLLAGCIIEECRVTPRVRKVQGGGVEVAFRLGSDAVTRKVA